MHKYMYNAQLLYSTLLTPQQAQLASRTWDANTLVGNLADGRSSADEGVLDHVILVRPQPERDATNAELYITSITRNDHVYAMTKNACQIKDLCLPSALRMIPGAIIESTV